MPVDYSKFDKIECSDSEGEQEVAAPKLPETHSDMFPSTAGYEAPDAPPAASADIPLMVEPSEAIADFVAAARFGDVDDINAAIAAGVVDIDVIEPTKGTALLMASANGHLEVVHALLEARASTVLGNEAGSSPLHWAALNNHLDVCKALVEARADISARNEFKRRAFDEAFGRTNTEVCEFLAPKTDFDDDAPKDVPKGAESGTAPPEPEVD